MPLTLAFLSRFGRAFNGHTPYQEPLGGTQCAVVFQARSLAALGHQVYVFCQGDSADIDGVSYRPVGDLPKLARQLDLDAFIPVADEAALKLRIPARQTLAWLHNDYPFLWHELPDIRAEHAALLATRADRVVATSHWQAEMLRDTFALPTEHVQVIPLGIQPEFFAAAPLPEQPPRLFYTSAPNRGLDLLLDLWPRLHAAAPCELHLYASFKTWGMRPEKDQEAGGALYARARALAGVHLHEPVSPPMLAAEMARGSLWVYPQHCSQPLPQSPGIWVDAETFCLAALEAQAAGLPVVASARGALSETVIDGQTGLLIPGDPHSPAFAEAFITACVQLLQDAPLRKRFAQTARQRALRLSWQAAAKQWEHLLQETHSTRLSQPPLSSAFLKPRLSVLLNLDETACTPAQLERCLQALKAQSFQAFEVLAYTRNPALYAVAKGWRESLNLRCRLLLAHESPLDVALKVSRAQVLLCLDPGLSLAPDTLEKHLQVHRQGLVDGVRSTHQRLCLSLSRASFAKFSFSQSTSQWTYAVWLQEIEASEMVIQHIPYKGQ